MSDPIPPPESDVALQNVALAFINLFPSPSDDQVQAFAGLLGYPYVEFEAKMQELLSPVLVEDETEDIDLEDEEANPLDTFLLSFFIIHPEPTEEQLNVLSVLLDMTPEELEQETFRVINALTEDVEAQDSDLDSDFEADAEDGADDDTLLDGDDTIQLI